MPRRRTPSGTGTTWPTTSPENVWWQFHKKNFGETFEYKDFAPRFKTELFDANQWADILYRSGAKYVVPTSKHHDGYAIWPSTEASRTWGRPWNSAEVGPHRDLLGELTEAVRKKEGMRIGFYYSLYEWFNPLWLKDRKRYVAEHMHPQFKDVVSRYRPSIIFADGEWDMPSSDWKSEELLAWLFNESPCKDEVVVNDRWGKECRHHHGGYYTTEYGAGMRDDAHAWEESRGMGFSYGYNRMETRRRLPDPARADSHALRPGQPGRQPAARHRPDRRRPDSRRHAGPADPDGQLAEGQRRGHLRHPPCRPGLPVDGRTNGPGRATRNTRKNTT